MDEDVFLVESMAICEYLEAFTPSLLPGNPIQKAKVRAVCEQINSGIQPLQNLNVLQKLEKDFSVDGDGKIAWAAHFNAKGLKGVEEMIKGSAGKYCFGDEVSLADVFLVPQVYSAASRFKVSLDDYPTVKRVYENLIGLEAFVQADPSNQPDCPK